MNNNIDSIYKIECLLKCLQAATPTESGNFALGTPVGSQFADEERKIIKDKLMEYVKSL